MAVLILNRCPIDVNICLTRGDTEPFGFQIKNPDGTPADLSGSTFRFTVNTEEEPTDAANQVFTVTGNIAANVVSFNLSTPEADNLGDGFFFDLQETNASSQIFTVAKGGVEWKQDIAK